ncbi:MAG TPA: TIGR03668 family PPOX class F420-dependent oxidoreductase [Candidatus Tectomicrobia bacterium]|nr:TIGR03668 family PPOX class F420-dependent oxidoreductase [Candidatus Tectomicrobia bacterium]
MSLDAPAWALEFLASARVGRLATADAAGRPLVVPVCFVFDGARCYWAVDPKPKRTRELRRLRHIAENPRVALVVDRYDEDWTALRWVILEGAARVVDEAETRHHALALLCDKYHQYRALGLATSDDAVVEIVPERVLAWRAT